MSNGINLPGATFGRCQSGFPLFSPSKKSGKWVTLRSSETPCPAFPNPSPKPMINLRFPLMRFSFPLLLVTSALALSLPCSARAQAPAPAAPAKGQYQNFVVAIYIPVAVVNTFAEPGRLDSEWRRISSQLKVDKVYIEAHRDRVVADEALLETVKKFFLDHGVRAAGGITFTDAPADGAFGSFCYTNPADREFAKKAMERVARHFDEIILDDYFFVTTKNDSDIAAKGNRSWTQFRLDLMNEVGRDLVVGAAKAVNPRAKVTIKYPNWYGHFAGLGFDLEEGPKIFDGIYTGTETRDPDYTEQFLQQYESYQIIRYFEAIAPGRNGGGWVDTFSIRYVDRYAEQLWDTMFAKAREMTLFFWGGMLEPVEAGKREAWQSTATSFDYNQMLKHVRPGTPPAEAAAPTWARAAGYALEQADAIVGKLGNPIGIPSYRPPHALGEDFSHNYFGMMGIPIDLRPTFPEDAPVVLLTEEAKADSEIVSRIKRQLVADKSVIVTSGLYQALQGRGIEDIVELQTSSRRVLADGYSTGFESGDRDVLSNRVTGAPPILFPQIGFLTNDAWALVNAISDTTGYPILLLDRYSKKGHFYVWTLPDNLHHLYRLPTAVTSAIKDVVMQGFPVRLDGPSQVALFAYDNHTVIVESFLPESAKVKVAALGLGQKLRDLISGEVLTGQAPAPPKNPWEPPAEPRTTFEVSLAPHSYRAFALEP